jgi:hypothetical protein
MVGDYAEIRGKEGLGQPHLHLTAIGQSGKGPIGIGIFRQH